MEILKYIKQCIYIATKMLGGKTLTISWIDERLAVGDIADSTLRDSLREQGVEIVIDARLYFLGSGDSSPLPMIWKAANEILIISETNKVLIHCQAGIDRSPFLAMLYYKLKHGCEFYTAYDYVLKKRPQTIQHWEWVEEVMKW